MSTHSTFLTEQINDYLVERFSAEDDFLRELLRDAEARKIPAISIAPEQTAFLQVLLRANNARRVLEIGSLAGYSAITMARALPPDGSLTALEIDPDFADFIRSKAAAAGLDTIVNVITGPGLESIAAFPAGTQFDVVFIDADKPNYANYLDAVFPLVRVGGLIIGDNALAWGEIANPTTGFEPHNVHALQSFNDRMSTHPKLQSTLVPLGDGMVIGIKLAE
jgi:predicted O-methyltransferase YrrM